MQSASSVGFSDTPTFTFWQVGYSSVWVDLQEVERYGSLNPTGGGFMPLQTPTARQAASVAVYDSSTMTFPLLDIANHYVQVGSSFTPSVLGGLSQSQVAADLLIPASPVAQAILASAEMIGGRRASKLANEMPTPLNEWCELPSFKNLEGGVEVGWLTASRAVTRPNSRF